MSIHQLPAEIVHKVLLYMPTWDLASMQLTCKSLYALAVPILYGKIDFPIPNWFFGLQPIHLLGRTLSEQPEIGQYIREISLSRDNSKSGRKMRSKLVMDGRRTIVTALGKVLRSCTRLESICLHSEFAESEIWDDSVGRRYLAPKNQRLQNLKRLDFDKNGRGPYYHSTYPKEFSSLFSLPQIESVQTRLYEGLN